MTNNVERKKDKKQKILIAAEKLFVTNGYKKTSIAEVAKEADSSQVTLYKYYPSKIALGRAVVNRLIVDGYEEFGNSLDNPDKTFEEKIQDMIVGGVTMADNISDDFVIFMYGEFSGDTGDTSVMETYNALKQRFWKKLLDKGRAEGVVNPKITDEGAMIFLDMFISYSMNSNPHNYHSAIEIKNNEDNLMHLFFYGIMGH